MIKICVITGSRADYGILKFLMMAIKRSSKLKLQLLVTGMHLSKLYGYTYKEIEEDGFKINIKIPSLSRDNDSLGISKSVSKGILGFAEAYKKIKPDIVLALGDRYEIFAALIPTLFNYIPIIHIHGGEITEGSFDNVIRNAITKMSQIHFVSTLESKNRVIQMGENPSRVFNVGSLGVENIKKVKLLKHKQIEKELKLKLSEQNFLVTFHPTTLEPGKSSKHIKNLLDTLKLFPKTVIIFTLPNSDTESLTIRNAVIKFVNNNANAYYFVNLGQKKYYSILKYMDIIIGNSSSGIIEAPSFGIPTVNIGNRQKGRERSNSIIDCSTSKNAICKAIDTALSLKINCKDKKFKNPYFKKNTSKNIVKVLENLNLYKLEKKDFYDIKEILK